MEVFRASYFDTEYGSRLVNSVFRRESRQSLPINTPDQATGK
jgi:hypothetical protein